MEEIENVPAIVSKYKVKQSNTIWIYISQLHDFLKMYSLQWTILLKSCEIIAVQ